MGKGNNAMFSKSKVAKVAKEYYVKPPSLKLCVRLIVRLFDTSSGEKEALVLNRKLQDKYVGIIK